LLSRAASLLDLLQAALSNRVVLALLATGAAIYMYPQAHADGVALAGANGFGSDFHGTIWSADRAILHGLSPYPSPSQPFAVQPAVYLPPIFLATLPFGWLSLHVATWVWFGGLLAAAFGLLAVLDVRDPWCYALLFLSLPVEQALVLGNASILVAFGVALAWRFRFHPILGPLAVAATVTVKFWLWPLIVWLLIVRPRAGVLSGFIFGALTLVAWAAIGFHGLLEYPRLMHAEGGRYAGAGVLFVAALIQLHVAVRLAAALGILGGLMLLGAAWLRRTSEIESLSLALLAALVATPVAWPHYLVLMAVPIAITWRTPTLAWAWFPALWLATQEGLRYGQAGYSLAFCLFAVLPVVTVFVAHRNHSGPLPPTPR
jgi:Glycosyltransferase family 87